jgi:hypothetical protein
VNSLNALRKWRTVSRKLPFMRKTLKINGSGISGGLRKTGSVFSWRAKNDVNRRPENVKTRYGGIKEVWVLRRLVHPLYTPMWEMAHLFTASALRKKLRLFLPRLSRTLFRPNGNSLPGNERRWPASVLNWKLNVTQLAMH